MNFFFQVLIMTFLMTVAGLVGCDQTPKVTPSSRSPQCISTDTIFCVIVPSLTTVQPKQDNSIIGQMIDFNPQKRQLTIELDGDSESVSIDDIERVTFKGQQSLPNETNPSTIVLRGQEIWTVEPLGEFRLNAGNGQAELTKGSVMIQQQSSGFGSSQAGSYMLQAMWFSKKSPEKMILKVVSIVE